MEINNIQLLQRISNRIKKSKENPSKYLQEHRDKDTRRLKRRIRNYTLSENLDKKNQVIKFSDLYQQIRNLPPVLVVAPPAEPTVAEAPVAEAPPAEATAAEAPPLEKTSLDCAKLFDPCTKEPISNILLLEKRVREIKRQSDLTPVGLYGLNNITSNYDFLMNVFVNPNINLDDMVSFKLSQNRTAGADIFETLSRFFVFFGGLDTVNPRQGGNYRYMDKIEDGGRIFEDTKAALQSMKCLASKGSGVSDITLIRVRDDGKVDKTNEAYCESGCEATSESQSVKTYVMSVKWYKDEKNAEHYDLEKLYAMANYKITSAEQKPVGIIVFLKSKKDFEIAHRRSYRQYTRELANTFFGWNEDIKPFLEEKRRAIFEYAMINSITPIEAVEKQYFIPGAKPILSLQLHQDIIVTGLCNRLETSDDNLYLIGVLPRGGKTFIAGGIIREYLKRNSLPNFNVFWLTAAPNETLAQVRDDLINRFQDFDTFEFIEVRSSNDIVKKKPNSIFFASSQLLLAAQKGTTVRRRYLHDLLSGKDKLGLVFFDEAHKTGTGDKTKVEIDTIITNYKQYNLPFIFLTATYYNILFDYKIQRDNTFIWDYTDVLSTRALATISEQASALANLQSRFGDNLVNTVINKREANNETLYTMAKAYIGFPDLFFLSADFQQEALARFAEQNQYRPDSGFSLSSIFAIRLGSTIRDIKTEDNKIRRDAYRIFENLVNPRNMISLITPFGNFTEPGQGGEPLRKDEGSPIEPSILGRINNMSRDAKSRFRLDQKPTLLMFMPVGGQGTNISYLLPAWASLLMSHTWWSENYEVACVVADEMLTEENVSSLLEMSVDSSTSIHMINKNPKMNIVNLERKLQCEKGKGLVILAGEKLSMGISLPCTDVVFLFNEKKSPDDIIQKMYRALTPSVGKTAAFVVDLNPVRTLAAVYGYTRASHENKNSSTELLNIIYDTYSWDSDIFEYSLAKGSTSKPLSYQERLRQLFNEAEQDTEYKVNEDLGGFERALGNNIRRAIDPDFVSKLRGQFSATRIQDIVRKIGLKDGTTVKLENGKLVIRTPKSSTEEGVPPQPETEATQTVIIIDNFIDTLSDFIKYLSITSNKSTLDDALAEYESNTLNSEGTTLRSNVNKLLHSRTSIQGDDNILAELLINAVKDFSLSSSGMVFRQMKGKVDEPSIRKDAVLKVIYKHLTPRHRQRKDFGEVFTQPPLIEEMLDYLPKSVWTNPNLTWIDPANGIGNFPVVVFYKLDEGLKEWEPNETKRRKHIITKMLFMLELQSNNTRIARNIFEKLCDGCSPNILTINSLDPTLFTKLKEKGFPTSYDIVMGNPPYQPSQLWEKFIKLALTLVKPSGYITFIVPTSWTSPTSDSWKLLKPKNIKVINSADYLGRYFPGVGSTFSYFLVQNKDSDRDTTVVYDKNKSFKVNLSEFEFLPKVITEDTLSISKKVLINDLPGRFIRKDRDNFRKERNTVFKFPYVTFIKRDGNPDIQYLNVQDPRQSDKKVLLFRSGYINPYYDDGVNGVGSNIHALTVKSAKEGEAIVKLFKSELYRYIWKVYKHSQYNHGGLMDMVFRDVEELPNLNDDTIYNFFKITPSEKQKIRTILNTGSKSVGLEEPAELSEAAEAAEPTERKSRYTHKTRKLSRR